MVGFFDGVFGNDSGSGSSSSSSEVPWVIFSMVEKDSIVALGVFLPPDLGVPRPLALLGVDSFSVKELSRLACGSFLSLSNLVEMAFAVTPSPYFFAIPVEICQHDPSKYAV